MTPLLELAARAEAADASEQSALLEEACDIVFADYTARDMAWRFCRMLDAEAYESAALMLLPEGWHLAEFGEGPNVTPRPYNFAYDGTWFAQLHATIPGLLHNLEYGRAVTPALALVAACLRAHADRETGQ